MEQTVINVLFIADIVGESGMQLVRERLPDIKECYNIDFCIANGENASDGKGLTEKTVEKLLDCGINVITSGNHIWERERFHEKMDSFQSVLRPLNYPKGNTGKGSLIHQVHNSCKIGVLNLQGRIFMQPIDCPFWLGMEEIKKLRKSTPCIIVDFHAEATAEKVAFALYVDGLVSAVIGTHTHVQTADERILPNNTAYITDAGMTGPIDSVIGINKKVAIRRFLYQIPVRYEVAVGDAQFNGVVITIDIQSGKAQKIQRISLIK
jgi:hypothetical protein